MIFFLPISLFAIWTSAFAIGKYTLLVSTPLFLTACRMLLAGFLLLAFLFFYKKKELILEKSLILPLVVLSIFNIYLTNVIESFGLQYLSSAKVCFINSLSPIFSCFFSYLHFNEKLTFKKTLGLVIGIFGFLPSFFLKTGAESSFTFLGFLSWPALAVVFSTLCSVYGWVILRIIVKKTSEKNQKTFSPLVANGYSMFFGGLLALIHSFIYDSWNPLPIAHGGGHHFVSGVLFLTLVSNIFCYNFYGYLLKKFTATFLSFVGLLSPIFASIFGWIFLKEPFSLPILFSTFVILIGMWFVYSEELRQGYIEKEKLIKT